MDLDDLHKNCYCSSLHVLAELNSGINATLRSARSLTTADRATSWLFRYVSSFPPFDWVLLRKVIRHINSFEEIQSWLCGKVIELLCCWLVDLWNMFQKIMRSIFYLMAAIIVTFFSAVTCYQRTETELYFEAEIVWFPKALLAAFAICLFVHTHTQIAHVRGQGHFLDLLLMMGSRTSNWHKWH